MSAGAQTRGVVGVVISGRCRDISEHHKLKFPVFARGHSTLGQSSFTIPSQVNIPLLITPQVQDGVAEADRFPPTQVEAGDWIIADRDGVVCVSRALESQVIELATKARVVDDLCMADILAGKGIQATFQAYRDSERTTTRGTESGCQDNRDSS